MAKTLRVHTLAKELGVSSKEVIEKCRAEGVELKNHMAAISAGLAESIREWFSAGQDVTSIEVADRIDVTKVRRPRRKEADSAGEPSEATTAVAESVEAETAEGGTAEETEFPESLPGAEEEQEQPEEAPQAEPVSEPPSAPPATGEIAPAAPVEVVIPQPEVPEQPQPERIAAEAPPEPVAKPAPMVPPAPPPPPAPPVKPAGPQVVPRPAELKGPRVVRIEAPEPVPAPCPRQSPAARGPMVEVLPAPVLGAERVAADTGRPRIRRPAASFAQSTSSRPDRRRWGAA